MAQAGVSPGRLMVLGLVFIAAGDLEMIKVPFPKKDIGEGLVMRAPVILPGPIDRLWSTRRSC
ncbi:hypothetical protein ACWD3Z_18395 [Streptomyces sp. NPDC002740]